MKFYFVIGMIFIAACHENEETTSDLHAKKGSFPLSPNPTLTPGALCKNADEFRYGEQIKYCERDVSQSQKAAVIKNYVDRLGYDITDKNRDQFKIDHYIPLCMGGSNELINLWPQHERIYTITDPVEKQLCDALSAGRLSQKRAVTLMKQVKANPNVRIKIGSE